MFSLYYERGVIVLMCELLRLCYKMFDDNKYFFQKVD